MADDLKIPVFSSTPVRTVAINKGSEKSTVGKTEASTLITIPSDKVALNFDATTTAKPANKYADDSVSVENGDDPLTFQDYHYFLIAVNRLTGTSSRKISEYGYSYYNNDMAPVNAEEIKRAFEVANTKGSGDFELTEKQRSAFAKVKTKWENEDLASPDSEFSQISNLTNENDKLVLNAKLSGVFALSNSSDSSTNSQQLSLEDISKALKLQKIQFKNPTSQPNPS